MPRASIDFETRSVVDLRSAGADRYAEDESTGVWCMAWCIGDGPVHAWRPGDPDPAPLLEHIAAGGELAAWNAPFEAAVFHYVIRRILPHWPQPRLEQWHCTMARALALALPGTLEKCAVVLNLPFQKDMAGHRLMLKMSRPARGWKPGEPLRWHENAEDLEKLTAYCKQDVETERAAAAKLAELTPAERRVWLFDQNVNRRGICLDLPNVRRALEIVTAENRRLNTELKDVTAGAVSTATQRNKLLEWLHERGVRLDSLRKRPVKVALDEGVPDPWAHRALEIRQQASKASTAKLRAMLKAVSGDGRARGLLGYHVATTGRFAGRRIQPQNFPRPIFREQSDIDAVLDLLEVRGAADMIRAGYAEPIDAISSCLKALIVAPPGRRLIGGDLANIEGRVLAWLAGEAWKLRAFREYDAGTGFDLYILAYARSFGVDPASIKKNDPRRQIGKVQELALGYQGSVGAFTSMSLNYPGVNVAEIATAVRDITSTADWEYAREQYPGEAKAFGLSEPTWTGLKVVVDAWREAHPKIKAFWRDLQNCAIDAVLNPGTVFISDTRLIKYVSNRHFLFCQLPSGRCLAYARPSIVQVPKKSGSTRPQLQYYGQGKKSRKWEERRAYGGLLAENVTQAVARDILVEAMLRMEAAGYPIVLHVHDEAVAEVPEHFGSKEEFERILCASPPWGAGLPIAASAWTGIRYQKG